MLYHFDEAGGALDLVPMAARRALDWAGRKVSLAGWRSLGLDQKRELVRIGASASVDVAAVQEIVARATPEPEAMAAVADPAADRVPREVAAALAGVGALADSVWSALSALDRYALAKVARKGREERLSAAYQEIIGHSAVSPHVSAAGGVRMVDVAAKAPTHRTAVAETWVHMDKSTFQRLHERSVPKGDVLGTARLAGIIAAKKTADLIPLCHPLSLTKVTLELSEDSASSAVRIEARVEAMDRTGVEMEALTAASVAALTIYDMLKAFDRGMQIGPTRLLSKSGGRSGDYARDGAV
jgi:cyclic pyranopterin phosphate synthase